jgi:hypothetical protein
MMLDIKIIKGEPPMSIDIHKPIESFVGLLILLALYAGFIGYILNSITSVGLIEGMGVFGTVITVIGSLIVGAYVLLSIVKRVRESFN